MTYVDVCRRTSHSLAKNSNKDLKILGARTVIHSQCPQVAGATVENLVATATRRQRLVHLCDDKYIGRMIARNNSGSMRTSNPA